MSGNSRWGLTAFMWMVDNARVGALRRPGCNLGVGRMTSVILGAIPLDEPDDRIPGFNSAGSVNTIGLVVPEAGGNDEKSCTTLSEANIIFIRGGDQGRYVKWWRGTKIEKAIHECFDCGGVIAGTSAGCAVLGEVTYTAENDSLSPAEALSDPHHHDLTLARGYLGLVPGVFFDTHFTERGRIGRFAVMLARARELFEGRRDVLGMGMDPRTAAAVSPDRPCEIMGEGTATLLRLTKESRVVVEKGRPPTVTGVRYDQLLHGTRLALPDGIVTERPECVKPNPHPEVIEDTAFDALTMDGGKEDDGAVGILKVVREGEGEAAAWKVETGEGKLPASLVTARTWDRGVWERIATSQRALAMQPGLLAWWLGEGCAVDVDAMGLARVRPDSTISAILVDSRGVTHAGIEEHDKGRPKAHLEGATMHVLGPGWGFDLRTRRVVEPAEK
ncbi:Cyanophycinase [Phycisphaerales bacterium]|nr:Cyanophycinase [Phycisphaerales bacterium]